MQSKIDTKANLKKLLTAARSGEYEQTKCQLRDSRKPNCYCFLGLACEISGLGKWLDESDSYYLPNHDHQISQTRLTYTVAAWYGFRDSDPVINFPDNEGNEVNIIISRLNDVYDYSFKEIADLIEKQFLNN